MKTFLSPLTPEQESDCLKRIREGDPAAKNELTLRNMRLVAHVAKKYQNSEEDMEDLISIGTIGLIKAVASFDSGKGKLSTYASRCIDNELLMLLRSKKKTSKEVSLYEPIGTDKEGNEINLLDIIESEQIDVIDRMELGGNIRKLGKVLQTLDRREKEIIFLRYGLATGKEVTQREIGERLGISRSYVSRIEKKALHKLKMGFERE